MLHWFRMFEKLGGA